MLVAPPAVPVIAPPTPTERPDARTGRCRARRLLSTAGLAVLVVGLLLAGYGPAGGIVFGFLLLTPLEVVFRRHDQRVRRPELRTDMLHLLFTGVLTTGCAVVAIVAWAIFLFPLDQGWVPGLFGRQPVASQAVEAFVLFEIMGYLAHRLSHQVPQFWRFHKVHHSSRNLDWISGARAHPVEGLITGSIIAPPLLLLGVKAPTLGALTVLVNLWGALLHANVRWRFRWMDGWWGTPEYHHWHHSNHAEARDKNFSAFLPIIDRIAGTYYQPKDRRPQVYGIDEQLPPTWWGQIREPLRRRRGGGWKNGDGASNRIAALPQAATFPPPVGPARLPAPAHLSLPHPALHGPTFPDVRFVT